MCGNLKDSYTLKMINAIIFSMHQISDSTLVTFIL